MFVGLKGLSYQLDPSERPQNGLSFSVFDLQMHAYVKIGLRPLFLLVSFLGSGVWHAKVKAHRYAHGRSFAYLIYRSRSKTIMDGFPFYTAEPPPYRDWRAFLQCKLRG